MDVANNIIVFPNKNLRLPQTIEEVADTLDIVRQVHIQETLQLIVPMLFDNISHAGFNPDDKDENALLKHGAMVVEAVRSFLCKVSGIEHPLQIIAENLFEQVDSEGNLEVSDKVKIVITPNDGKS
jgi:hypothetical protein